MWFLQKTILYLLIIFCGHACLTFHFWQAFCFGAIYWGFLFFGFFLRVYQSSGQIRSSSPFCSRKPEHPRQYLLAILFSWLESFAELLLSVSCPVPVYLNSRVAAAQSQGPVMALRVHDVYDILSGAQQNSGKHLGLRKIHAVTKAILRWRDCCK